jgi:hypothetical protein
MDGADSKQSVIFSMKHSTLWIGCTMNKLLALIARAKLVLLTEEFRQKAKK